MSTAGPLGEYLRARRELIGPGDVGLPPHGRRRVPGLRREELALLAGISADYYLRLEQGRDRRPSTQVLDALARALRLDAEATAHLHRLGRQPSSRRPTRRPERVPVGIRQLVGSWTQQPAFVHGRHLDVLFANPLATALAPIYAVGVNLLRAVFLDPSVPSLYPASEAVAANAVAGLRAQVGAEVDDPRLTELVEELSAGSERFRRLWARHDVVARAGGGTRVFHHPRVGELELRYEKLTINGTTQSLVVYHAEPGSPSARSLARLGAGRTAVPAPESGR
ncbi:helix-turn-helix transcriptional regulator [Micromonospora sp. WMMD710]|uniref:helix-turn-helix domain-containing protein n=1 Tax=Micromonospora sp. WMMD710 TaxID=3016085 RepID=UPI0024161A6A|nr:helix-turn-helix transcriptional regulator [Micromonospora sp. WMMD710]MDG4759012.1 helix-turn-helix transcriptional regulator [Micromonospora sp. WMMD710]